MSLIRPDRRREAPRHGSIGRIRQWIESVNDTLKGQLDLERHGAPTIDGIYARVAQRLPTMTTAIWHNWITGAAVERSLTAYDPMPLSLLSGHAAVLAWQGLARRMVAGPSWRRFLSPGFLTR